ncbi:hypothetical protein L0Y59_04655, partial [Candidatus Uhrbacteria bacterium]|nr:hypothetical protein [Candidatus Uhrbacteria bacterium]
TAVPHVDYVDLYPFNDGIANSVLNSQVDVDIGDSNTYYTLEVMVYDSLGWDRLADLEIWMWYDDGATLADVPTAMGATFDNPGAENKRMHFTIDETAATVQMYPAPAPGTEEATLIGGEWNQFNASAVVVTLRFSPHQQVRFADGPFTEVAPNMRYDPDADDIQDPREQTTVNALNNANTWDIKVTVADDAPTTNYDSAFDEFGFFRYTYLSTSGIPNGGAVYGSGAPGTNNVVMTQSNADVTFCANCPYILTVTLASALIGVAVPANTIPGTAVSIRGGQLGAENSFAAAGSTITLIGGPRPPLNYDRTTTTSSWDDDPGTLEQIVWEVNIPGVPEDSYVSTITWSLVN